MTLVVENLDGSEVEFTFDGEVLKHSTEDDWRFDDGETYVVLTKGTFRSFLLYQEN